ncbi:MAG: two-component system chemotaxis sensor kinase CheA [Parvibaculaceae bacterium]|jgi:two-component system chemotaxis sensor kinase CheA
MDDLLREFLTETNESLDVVDVELVKFEQDPNNEDILGNIFRLVHTIKGTCGFLGLPRLESLAHAAETLMGKYRDGSPVTNDGVTVILHSIDRLKEILGGLEESECEPEGDDNDLIGQLANLAVEADGGAVEATQAVAEPEPEVEPEAAIDVADNTERAVMPGEVTLDELERAFQEAEGPELAVPESMQETLQTSEPQDIEAKADDKPAAGDMAKADAGGEAPRKESSIANQSIRVNVDTLENLMTMVSELVLTRNQLMEMVRRMDDSEFKVPLQRLSGVTGELQEAVMKTRMQPIGNAWQKLPRIVRDLSKELDKKIDLEMIGADTELDRQVLDLIKDPLTHMVRNSADHGLETTAERIEAGKGDRGRVTLRAYHEGGHIIIEIADDGRGLDAEKIKAKVLSNGLATESELEGMTESQIFRYIFNAGFSTAAAVTSVSGRGVGMDVVRTNIELIGGSVDLRSTTGKGTTFTIKIPLTLAIVSALIVESCKERFAIPQLAVVELVRAKSDSEHRIEKINDTPVLRLRNRLLPLVFLDELLHSKRTGDSAENAEERIRAHEEAFIVVTRVGEQSFGVVVDSVFDTEEIVVKPAATLLRDISMFSGNTILGDGSVIMIMDPNGIAQTISGELSDTIEAAEESNSQSADESETSLLVFRAGTPEPKAVPLSLVTRLEEFDVKQLENSNGMSLVQYRGRLMPIMHVSEGTPLRSEGRQAVLVFTEDERSVGLAVDEIVDIVTDRLDVELTSEASGILGSAVIRDQATEILDVGHYLTRVFADWFRKPERLLTTASKRLLLVDDSPFFRSMLLPQLSMSGYKVTQAASAEEAWALRDAGEMFDVIISDIEMPGVNGYEFVASLKKDEAWTDTPVIALSAHGTEEDVARGREAGFDDYVAKFDREGLIQVLNEMLVLKGEAA